MYTASELRHSAQALAKKARKLAYKTANESSDTAHVLAKRFRKTYYPRIVENVNAGANKALQNAGYYATSAKYGVRNVSAQLGRDVRFVEAFLIHIGLGYLVIKVYNACNGGPASASQRLKAHIHEKPVESVVIALGVGYLLGKLFR